jgi:hypothetical protein
MMGTMLSSTKSRAVRRTSSSSSVKLAIEMEKIESLKFEGHDRLSAFSWFWFAF